MKTSIFSVLTGYNGFTKTSSILVSVILIILCRSGAAQSFNEAKLDTFFDKLDENEQAMGSISLIRNNELIYSRSIGYCQIKDNELLSMTPEVKHRIGSVTKVYTATIILQLFDEGKLDLNDRLHKYFPEFPNAHKITIDHLLSHRSGIHDIMNDPAFRNKRELALSKREMLGLIAQSQLGFEPGSQFKYSNAGYFILGLLIEKVCQMSYQQSINERLLTKLDLTNTYVSFEEINSSKSESFSYKRLSSWQEQSQTHWSVLLGAGSLISTSKDMGKFIHALFNSDILSKESLDKMIKMKDGYGLGIESFQLSNKKFYGHTGGIDGFGAWVAYLPEEKLTISYVTNAKVYPVEQIIKGVANIYFDKPFDIPTFKSVKINSRILDEYAGIYVRDGAPVKFKVVHQQGSLFISMNDSPLLPLKSTSEKTFKLESQGMTLEFDIDRKEMLMRRGPGSRVFKKQE